VTACVRVPVNGGREQHVAEFPTTVNGPLELRDWLAGHGVTQVVMEATGVYWKAPWAILEDEFDCLLVKARHIKQVPGRKTDVSDAAWLCQLAEAGLWRASFVPPKAVRQLRNITRYRKTHIQERAREVNRLPKALEDAGIKLDCVAADVMGKSGRDMLDALVAGETDAAVLAQLARRQMRKKIPLLRERWPATSMSTTACGSERSSRTSIFLDEQIARLSVLIEEQIRRFASQVELLCTIAGVQRRGAECIPAEIGADMTRFVTARHLTSWAGQCPGNDQSAGKRRSGRTREGSKWPDFAREEAAMSAIRVKHHYLEAQYRRLKPRRGHKHALGAVRHTILTATWHMLSTGELYRDLGGDYFTHRDPEPQTRRLVAQLERLGHTVTLAEGLRRPERTFPVRQTGQSRRIRCHRCSVARAQAAAYSRLHGSCPVRPR
jgi:transposase